MHQYYRSSIIDKLKYLKLVGTASEEQLKHLEKYEKEHSENPFEFLKKVNLSNLNRIVEDLNKIDTQLASHINLSENQKVRFTDVLKISKTFEMFSKKGWLAKGSLIEREFIKELKNNEPNLTKFTAYLDSIEKLKTLKLRTSRTEIPKLFKRIENKKQNLWKDLFEKTNDVTSSIATVASFCEKIERLDMITSRLLIEIEKASKVEPKISEENEKNLKEALDHFVKIKLLEVEDNDVDFSEFLSKTIDAIPISNLKNLYIQVIKDINYGHVDALKGMLTNVALRDNLDKRIENLTTDEHHSFNRDLYFNLDKYAIKMRVLDEKLDKIESMLFDFGKTIPDHADQFAVKKNALVNNLIDMVWNENVSEDDLKREIDLIESKANLYCQKMEQLDIILVGIDNGIAMLKKHNYSDQSGYDAKNEAYENKRNELLNNLLLKIEDDTVTLKAFASFNYDPHKKPDPLSALLDKLTQSIPKADQQTPAETQIQEKMLSFSNQHQQPPVQRLRVPTEAQKEMLSFSNKHSHQHRRTNALKAKKPTHKKPKSSGTVT